MLIALIYYLRYLDEKRKKNSIRTVLD